MSKRKTIEATSFHRGFDLDRSAISVDERTVDLAFSSKNRLSDGSVTKF
jgi:hypothetical protein